LPSIGIGATLRQARLTQGLAIEDISRDTRIAVRYLEAIEAQDFESLPGLVFTRNFVRQFARFLKLDPEPLVAALPVQDAAALPLPDPPARPRSSHYRNRRIRAALSSAAALLIAGAVIAGAWYYFNHPTPTQAANAAPRIASASSATLPATLPATQPHPVQVRIQAHQSAWVQMVVDGKAAFSGTLRAEEIREIAADEQVKIIAGNAGALTISLNGKTLEPLGPVGEVRVVRLTAEGTQFLSQPQPPEPDPL
jgi:hypothetical protein